MATDSGPSRAEPSVSDEAARVRRLAADEGSGTDPSDADADTTATQPITDASDESEAGPDSQTGAPSSGPDLPDPVTQDADPTLVDPTTAEEQPSDEQREELTERLQDGPAAAAMQGPGSSPTGRVGTTPNVPTDPEQAYALASGAEQGQDPSPGFEEISALEMPDSSPIPGRVDPASTTADRPIGLSDDHYDGGGAASSVDFAQDTGGGILYGVGKNEDGEVVAPEGGTSSDFVQRLARGHTRHLDRIDELMKDDGTSPTPGGTAPGPGPGDDSGGAEADADPGAKYSWHDDGSYTYFDGNGETAVHTGSEGEHEYYVKDADGHWSVVDKDAYDAAKSGADSKAGLSDPGPDGGGGSALDHLDERQMLMELRGQVARDAGSGDVDPADHLDDVGETLGPDAYGADGGLSNPGTPGGGGGGGHAAPEPAPIDYGEDHVDVQDDGQYTDVQTEQADTDLSHLVPEDDPLASDLGGVMSADPLADVVDITSQDAELLAEEAGTDDGGGDAPPEVPEV